MGESGKRWTRGSSPGLCGIPLGVFEDAGFEAFERALSPGEIIVIGTDGIWEAVNEKGEMFGKAALKKLVRTHSGGSSAAILSAVIEALKRFAGAVGLADDITLVVIKASGGPQPDAAAAGEGEFF